jgi:hypothetical protein
MRDRTIIEGQIALHQMAWAWFRRKKEVAVIQIGEFDIGPQSDSNWLRRRRTTARATVSEKSKGFSQDGKQMHRNKRTDH